MLRMPTNRNVREKTPLLLLDRGHIYLVLGGTMGLAEVIDGVHRHASQTGEACLSASDFTIGAGLLAADASLATKR